ncbi:MAG: HAMP domain-containing histidine kinase [Deltaproteobacteria bacterium]|nr:HAMP domain-containing histidine kinase [Deltaproteobacteria bacterium]
MGHKGTTAPTVEGRAMGHNRGRREARREEFTREREARRVHRPASKLAKKKKRKREWTPEERRYRAARSRANRRIGWLIHLVSYVSVLALILVSSRSVRATVIVALAWGIGLAIHYLAAILAPGLRERWIAEEMDRHVEQGASRLHAVEHANARSLEDLSASIAHEIRNPVTAAKSLVQQMGEDPVSGDNIQYARVALEELDRVERSISHLLKYAREEEFRFEPLSLPDIVDSAVASLRDRFDALGVEVDVEYSAPCTMRGDVEKLRRVTLNLLRNAMDALEEAGTETPCVVIMAGENLAGTEVWLRIENLAGTEVWLRIRDNGPGMSEEVRRRIFDPFYTTKSDGTGLGLALSKKVVESHGGSMEVQADSSSGTEFLLTFPQSLGSRETPV